MCVFRCRRMIKRKDESINSYSGHTRLLRELPMSGGFIRAYAMCRAKARLINDPYKKLGWCPLIPYREEKENGVCEEMRQMWKVI